MLRRFKRYAPAPLLFLMAMPALCQDRKQVEQQLRKQYQARIVQLHYAAKVGRCEVQLPKEERGVIDPGNRMLLMIDELRLKKNGVELRARRLVPYKDATKKPTLAAGRTGVYRLHWPTKVDEQEVEAMLGQILSPFHSVEVAWSEEWNTWKPSEEEGEKPPWYRVGGGVSLPVCIRCQQPEYPEALRQARVEGLVVLHCVINENGLVRAIQIDRSPAPQMDAAAVLAVGSWRFRPAQRQGKPVAVYFTIEVEFHLY